MSKLKLFLLGGIFTLVGIFNFSIAETYYGMSYKCSVGSNTEYNQCGDDVLYFDEEVSEFTVNITSNDENITNVYLYSLPNGPSFEKISNFPLNVNCVDSLCNGINIWNIPSYDSGVVDITITLSGGGEGGELGQIISGGFDNFTPAVNGLHEIVKQLIPLVIYLGIGVLVVILGFIAIRWLVNWMFNGIKSKFSSKRS